MLKGKGGKFSRQTQRGVIVFFAAILVLILVGVMGFTLDTGRRISKETFLQGASDAASHAGATVLCSTQGCWDEARLAAINLIQTSLNVSLNSDTDGPWEVDGYEITIERGRYTDNSGFESMEGDWQSQHPGAPKFIMANAVHTAISNRGGISLFSGLGLPGVGVSVQATAISGPVNETCAAPFAIPVCALINSEGNFDPSKQCYSDRLIGRTTREQICIPEMGCLTLPPPGFPWRPTSASELIPIGANLPSVALSVTTGWRDVFYGIDEYLNTASASSIFDNFGVVGLPGNSPTVTEEYIQLVLGNSTNPCTPARIGDSFHIKADGLNQQLTDNKIWEQINNELRPDGFSQYGETDLQHVEVVQNVCSAANPLVPPNDVMVDCALVRPFLLKLGGLCNSRRLNWFPGGDSGLPNPAPPSASIGTEYGCGLNLYNISNSDWGKVWVANAPVIADMSSSATACSGMLGSTEDAPLHADGDGDHDYQIIGFVKLNIMDTDIGRPPPIDPTHDACPYRGFGIWGNIFDCNYVRTRITCDSLFIPSSSPNEARHPQLVK